MGLRRGQRDQENWSEEALTSEHRTGVARTVLPREDSAKIMENSARVFIVAQLDLTRESVLMDA